MSRRITSHRLVLIFIILLWAQYSNSTVTSSSSGLARQSRKEQQTANRPEPAPAILQEQLDTSGRSNAPSLEDQNPAKEAANRIISEAEGLAAEWTAESLRKAIKKYQEARALFSSTGERLGEATAIKRIADIHCILGRNTVALPYYFRALALARAFDRSEQVGILNGIARTFGDLGDAQQALKYAEQAKQYSEEAGDRRAQAESMINLGLAFYSASDTKKALGALAKALDLWRAAGDYRGQAEALINMGYSYADSGELKEALKCYDQALIFARLSGDRRIEAQALTAIGGVYSWFGQKQQALHCHSQASQLFHTIGDRNGEAVTFNGLGYVYEDLGEKRQALRAYTRAMTLFKVIGNRFYEGLALGYIANVLQALGERDKALAFYKRRLAASRAFKNRHVEAYTLKHIGEIFAFIGNKRQALAYYSRALTMARDVNDKRGQSITLEAIGSTYEATGKNALALKYYEEALLLVREAEDRSAQLETLYKIARVKRNLGKLAEARSVIEEAVEIIDSIRLSVASQELRASYFASVRQSYELYVDILMRLHKALPSQGFDVLAFEASDRSRARSLLETIAEGQVNIRAGVPEDLLEKERSLQQLLRGKSEFKARLTNGKYVQEEAEELGKNITALTVELHDVQGRIKEASPHYAALTQPVSLTLAEIRQQTLDADTILLEYMMGEERSYLWAVSAHGISSHEIAGRKEIEALAMVVAKSLAGRELKQGETADHYFGRISRDSRAFSKAAQELSRIIFGPVASEIGTKRLLVVSEGALQYIPLSALPSPTTINQPITDQGAEARIKLRSEEAGRPMLFEHEIVYLASASTIALLRREAAGRTTAPRLIAVFADPVFDRNDRRVTSPQISPPAKSDSRQPRSVQRALQASPGIPRLPSTRREAEAILNIALPEKGMMAVDFDASRAAAMSDEMGQYRIIHFATHAVLDTEEPAQSGILLSLVDQRGKAQDGFLGLNDIYNLKLSADLVMLSACSTALGKEVRGEGLVGLGRGFMYAGVPRVVASLWKVDDPATANLMKFFYRAMLKEAMTPAAALRVAQIEMCKHAPWNSPYYWAAFVLQGEYN
jgi:CHAT domain-containing protein/tetratricopeptide (TPR) repeat protein